MSDVHVWTSREAARLVQDTLEPHVIQCADQARVMGPAEDVQVLKAHEMGRAQGLNDAIDLILAALGRPPGRVS